MERALEWIRGGKMDRGSLSVQLAPATPEATFACPNKTGNGDGAMGMDKG